MKLDKKIATIMRKNNYTNIISNIIKPLYNKYKILYDNIFLKYGLLYLYKFPVFHKFLYPKRLYIYLTSKCNLRCFICLRTYNNYIGKDIKFDDLRKIERAIKYAKIINLTGWGEATIYPKFKQTLEHIYSINPNKNLIEIITNGTCLSKEIASLLNGHLYSLTISLNAATEETYNRDMKNGNFIKTINNIKIFMNSLNDNEKDKINLHFVAHTENFKEIPQFINLAHELNISSVTVGQYLVCHDEHKKFSLFNIKQEYNNIILQSEKQAKDLNVFLGAQKFSNQSDIKDFTSQFCFYPFSECIVHPNGNIKVCCYSGSDDNMGNTFETTFETIWFGKRYNKLRNHRFLSKCEKCLINVSFDDPNAHYIIDDSLVLP